MAAAQMAEQVQATAGLSSAVGETGPAAGRAAFSGEDAVLDPERPFVQMIQELTKPGGMIPARREVKAKHA